MNHPEKLTKKNSILYNQEWIKKAIEEGHIDFLPDKKIPNQSIGEYIEMRYHQLYHEEFEKAYHNGYLNHYQHLISDTPKITKRNSLLFLREWLLKIREEEIPIIDCSTGNIIKRLTPSVSSSSNIVTNNSHNRKKVKK